MIPARAADDLTPFNLAVGHATESSGGTGCTVIRPIDGTMRGAVHVFGRASGSRELHALSPESLADRVDAVLLTGGSAYGLEAAAGVMRWCEEQQRGFDIGGGVVPIVPAAVIFDLAPFGRFDSRPTPQMAYDACTNASPRAVAEGSVGAGTGASVGKAGGLAGMMKGGLGLAIAGEGAHAALAIAVVNAFGDVRGADGRIIAGARDGHGGFADALAILSHGGAAPRVAMRNTTLAVVAITRALDRNSLGQLARAASAAMHRRITPAGTGLDGDVVFALCPRDASAALPVPEMLALEVNAARALEEAIERGVRAARGRDGVPGLADAP